MRNREYYLPFLLSIILFASCMPFRYEKEKVNHYIIWYEQEPKRSLCKINIPIIVRQVTGSDTVDTTQMVLKNPDQSVSYIPYSRWKATIPSMFEEVLKRDLLTFSAPFSGNDCHGCEIVISCHIYSFWVKVEDPSRLTSTVLFQVAIKQAGGARQHFKRLYEKELLLDRLCPELYAKAATGLVKELVEEFLEDLCTIAREVVQ